MLARETERLLVHRDEIFPENWLITVLDTSSLWELAFGANWDIYISTGAEEYATFYDRLTSEWDAVSERTGDDILICEIDVEYTAKAPPGIRSLRWGRHYWAQADQFWYVVGGGTATPAKVLGGFVRAIKVTPLSERGPNGQRREDRDEESEVQFRREDGKLANTGIST